jgi:outer membrane protein OmpA-like peptidoglycan-associated protein
MILMSLPYAASAADDCARATEMVIQAFDLGHTAQVAEQQKALLNQALAICPNHAEAHNNLAVILETERQYDNALSHYHAAVRANPGFAAAWFGLGEVYSKTGRFPLALEAWLNACHEDADARNRIIHLLDKNRFRVSEAGEIMDKESLLLLFDKNRREKIIKKIADCGFRASVVPEITFRNLQFDVGSARIQESSVPQLNEIAAALLEIPGSVKISGHTDKQPFKGHSREDSIQLNQGLSRDRAKTVADYLVRMGISPNRIQTQGFGSDKPLADGDSPEDYAKNRRVVIEVTE